MTRSDYATGQLPSGLVEQIQRRIVAEGAELTASSVARAVRAEVGALLGDAQMLQLIRTLQSELGGVGPLSALLADPETTDIVVNSPSDVRIDRGNGWELTDIRFDGEAGVQRLARRLALGADRRLDDAQPFVDAQLADGTRLHAVLAPVAASGTCISLRLHRPTASSLASLARMGTFPGRTLDVLKAILAARLSFLVSGGTGCGKTTLLSALLGDMDVQERIVLVEDVAELRPGHPHVLSLLARGENVEGAGRITLRNLVHQALRMRPDRVIVGEVRGPEVIDLLLAMNTGHEGGAGTIHANSVGEVPARLEALAALDGLDRYALHSQLAGAIQVVVHLRRTRQSRQVAEIGVLTCGSNGLVIPATVIDESGEATEFAPMLARLLAARSVSPPW